MVPIDSGSYNMDGLLRFADVLAQDFACLGFPQERHELASWESVNDTGTMETHRTGPALVWRIRPAASRQVLLLIHYDTVYPPGAGKTVKQQTERLIAPGAADAKGGIAVILATLKGLLQFQLAPDVGCIVVLNPDEEVGLPASRGFLQSLIPDVDFAMLFEPALPDGSWVADRKGSGNWSVVVHGRAAHAGRNPESGRNAVVHAAEFVTALDQLNDPTRGRSLNVARFIGGGPLNRVPDLATVHWNVRIGEPADQALLEQRFADLAESFSQDGYRCQLRGGFHAPVKKADPPTTRLRQLIEDAARQLGRQVRWQNTGGACDGNHLAAAGLPNVDSLGVTGGDLHSPTEYAELSSIVPAALTALRVLCDFYANPSGWPLRQHRENQTST